MKNCTKAGTKIYTLTAPSGGVVSGTFYRIGQLIVCALATVAQGLEAAFAADGEYTAPKATGQAWTEGALIYWSVANSNFTTTSASNILCGCAGKLGAASGDTTGPLILDGVARITT